MRTIAMTIIATLCVAVGSIGNATEPDAEVLFVRRIAPLIHEKCLACHGNDPDDIAGGLDMRSRGGLVAGGDSGLAGIVSGKPDESPIFLAATRASSDWSDMPPKEADKLYADQIAWLKVWIASGAPWPDDSRSREIEIANASAWSAEDGVIVKTSGGLSPEWTNRRYKPEGLWAYQPVVKPLPPTANSAGEKLPTSIQPIDAFIAAAIPVGLPVAPPVDPRTFIRRVTFDLTGLPPTPEEIAKFEALSRFNPRTAVATLVNRLLDSPHYGERMAQHWLDVVRYADTSGFANDYDRGNAWRYRDYVVRSFNCNKPYDQFIREQIAGDEINANDPELLVATGFLRMGPWELTSMEVAKVARQRFLDDVTNAVGETFLAHSLQCARCHDHKFDPIPTQDYYAFQACFSTTQLTERPASFLDKENKIGFDERKYLDSRAAEHLEVLQRLDAKLLANAISWYKDQHLDRTDWDQAVASATTFVRSGGRSQGKGRNFTSIFDVARSAMQKREPNEDRYPPKLVGFKPDDFGNERVARKGLERLRWEFERYDPIAFAVYGGRTPSLTSVTQPLRMPPDRMTVGELEQTAILGGGDPFSPTLVVMPAALSVLDGVSSPPIPDTIDGRRFGLANWIANRNNPLTSRAIVNRIWLWHFNEPLAGNPNNFGSTGKRPTHPALLDWLAATFVEDGWSVKSLHRRIMTSEAYRRGTNHTDPEMLAELDPNGSSLAVFKPRRLSAEELRDAMLATSGELNTTPGGIPNRPEINLEAALQPRQVMGTFAAAWVPNPMPRQRHRRSLYSLKVRGLPDPQMEVFNQPGPDFSCERREASTVTPQVFNLFNGVQTHGRALVLAHRVWRETHTDEDAIRRCFLLTLGRSATHSEITQCVAHWHEIEAMIASDVPNTIMPPLEITRDAVEENTGEKFSFQERLDANADFVADLQPAEVTLHVRALADVCLALFNSNEFAYLY